jgi:putative ABC transport system permease protein
MRFDPLHGVLSKLAVSELLAHKTRIALTVAAIALSVSLVVAVTSGYASAEGAAQLYLNRFLGSTDAQVTRQSHTPLDESIVAELARDPDVSNVIGRLENQSGLLDVNGKPVEGSQAHIVGIRRPVDKKVETLALVSGNWFEGDEGDVAVIDQVAAEVMNLKVGDSFALPGTKGPPLVLKVVAIVHKPGILAAHVQTVYVPLRTLQRFAMPADKPQVTRIMIEFKKDTQSTAFEARWKPRLAALDPLIKLRLTRESRTELDKNLQGVHALSYIGGTVSMVAATFIVFSALSMGVAERQRSLAMLRAIGMFRIQIGQLVVAEGALLALLGAAVGVPLGFLWVKILVSIPAFADLLTAGLIVSWGGVLMGAGGSMMAALAASALPAWNAMRVSPLEAMSPLASPASSRVPWKLILLGFALIWVDSFLLFGPVRSIVRSDTIARGVSFYGHFLLGLPCLLLGFFLLSPLFVRTIEAFVGPLVCAIFRLRYALLRQQLSSGMWRAAGTCAALMVGLALLVVLNVQGNSALSGWKLPDKFPDIFIAAPPLSSLDESAIEKLQSTPGLKRGEVMPIAIASPEFSNPIFAVIGAAVLPNATMFFGIDPDMAFKLMELDFREGTPEQAQELLKKGRHLVVTEEFRQLKGLHIGDTLALNTPRHGQVDYTIAGVVWSPGIDVIVSMQDMSRQFDQRTAASVFGTLADAKEDFGVDRVYLVAANLDRSHFEKDEVLKVVQQSVGQMGMKIGDIRAIKFAIQEGFQRLLLFISSVALAAMAVASLGVTNTIMASIRSRRWQFGILRSIGVTRGQLLRMVLAEATLLGLVGCALGLTAGALMSVNARGLSALTVGYVPPVTIPWGIVAIGSAAIMAISILASVVPAWGVARTEPLALLQAGRAAV